MKMQTYKLNFQHYLTKTATLPDKLPFYLTLIIENNLDFT